MGAVMAITKDEWLAELERISQAPEDDGYRTADEISRVLDKPVRWVRARLKELQADGRLMCSRKKVPALDGRSFAVPAYKVRT